MAPELGLPAGALPAGAQQARQWLRNAVDIGSQPSAAGPDRYAAEQAALELRKLSLC